jgi:integrase
MFEQYAESTGDVFETAAAAAAPGHEGSFAHAATSWFDAFSITWKASTIESVQSILRAHVLPVFGPRPLRSITRVDLLAFRARLIRENAGRRGATSMSPARANRIMAVVRQVLAEDALEYGSRSVGAEVFPLRERRSAIEPFTWAEVERIVAAAPGHLQEYVRVRCLTGMRSGEINGLRWDQVNGDRAVLSVTRARVRGREVLPKNEFSERELPLTQSLLAALARQARRTGSKGAYVFTSRRGQPISTSNFANRDWPAILAKAGVAMRRPYQTRHTAATLMLASGENPAWIARVLGHADCQMLWQTYARFIPNLTRADGSAFEGLVSRPRS